MPLFEYLKKTINHKEWNIVLVNINVESDFIKTAKREANWKMKFTMQAGQDANYRDNVTKFEKQFQGSLAEIYAQELIKSWFQQSSLNDWEVIRYDNVRTDGFQNPENSYDLKIQKSWGKTDRTLIECRSSFTQTKSIDEAIRDLDILGPYTNAIKTKENYVHFYIRPLFENLNRTKMGVAESFSAQLEKGRMNLFFVGGCDDQRMMQGSQKDMQQTGTKYRCVPITSGKDICHFRDRILEFHAKKDR